MGFFDDNTFTLDDSRDDSLAEKSSICHDYDEDFLYVLSDDLDIRRLNRLDGSAVGSDISLPGSVFNDTEGIAYSGNGTFCILNEDPVHMSLFQMSSGTTTLPASAFKTIDLNDVEVFGGGLGAEGICYDDENDLWYVVVQSTNENDGGLWKIDFSGGVLSTPVQTRIAYWTDTIVASGLVTAGQFVSDVAYGHSAAPINGRGNLYVLTRGTSDSRKVIEIDKETGQVYSHFDHGLAGQIEGVVFDRERGDMLITGEPTDTNWWRYSTDPINVTLRDWENEWYYEDSDIDRYSENFFEEDFDPVASGWATGNDIFGWGTLTGLTVASVNTTPANDTGDSRSHYFVSDFTIDDIDLYSQIKLNCIIDDGVVIWINGTEVAQTGVDDPISHGKLANRNKLGDDEGTVETFTLTDLSAFKTGTNRIAVMLFQTSASNGDGGWGVQIQGTKSGESSPITPAATNLFLLV